MKLLHIGNGRSALPLDGDFTEALRAFGQLELIPDGSAMTDGERAEKIRGCDVLLLIWGSMPIPEEIAQNPGSLKYICVITGEMRHWVPLSVIEAGIPVTNWGDASAEGVAEGAMALLLSVMKNIRSYTETVAAGGWGIDATTTMAGLRGCDVGIYGMGAIGRRFVELIRPFGATLRVFDPYVAKLPEGCARVDSLEELFDHSSIIAVHAGLSPETRHSVNGALLARLPDGGIIINTARGGLIDQDALFSELESGRLRAGLDVLDGPDGDYLPPDHPARSWPNLILTCHSAMDVKWGTEATLERAMYGVCLDNLRRFAAGEPLRFRMDRERYLIST